jgi:hypothetical protein
MKKLTVGIFAAVILFAPQLSAQRFGPSSGAIWSAPQIPTGLPQIPSTLPPVQRGFGLGLGGRFGSGWGNNIGFGNNFGFGSFGFGNNFRNNNFRNNNRNKGFNNNNNNNNNAFWGGFPAFFGGDFGGWGDDFYGPEQAPQQQANPSVIVVGQMAPPEPPAPPQPAQPVVKNYHWPEQAGEKEESYSIARRDGSIRSAIAVWIQGNEIRFATPDGTIEHLALSLVDRPATAKLNAAKGLKLPLPFITN